jgi:uncharacterized protein (DUF1778 family)
MTTKDHELRVRVSPADKARLEAAASARGLSLSAWIRMVALDAAKKEAKR